MRVSGEKGQHRTRMKGAAAAVQVGSHIESSWRVDIAAAAAQAAIHSP